ncbi:MAG: M13 family metallopeptidase [Thermomonas sp.]|uniref:M13 family metallopeptidase n=1 Tax=Thermomonas sp. TaxID=1971895 RepID=UPI002635DF0F|nr:M13 family metallopeptidase [Thermomonas sp.]MCC7097140.1 M13 family metallopeptidase [Thermomonas sp.]
MKRASPTHRQSPLPLFAAVLIALGGLVAVHAQGAAGPEVKLPLGYLPLKMDRSVDPRQDFYRYAAGQWLQQTEIPASDPDIGSFALLGHQLDKKLLSLIEEAAATTEAPKGSPRQQVGDFYRAAMGNARRDALGLKPLEADMKRIAAAGGTPADYGRLAARLQGAVGGSPLIMVGAMPDAKDSSTGVMVLAPGLQLLEQDEYTRPEHQKLRHLYHMYIVAMLNGIGEPIDAAKTQASRILSMEAQAAGAMLTPLQQRDPANTYNIMTLDQAQALMPALDLRVYLAELGIAVPSRVQVVDINAMKTLQKILTERPVDEIKLLLRWFLLASRAPELGQPWRLQEEAFTVERKGLKSPPEQAQVVTQQIGAQLYHPLSQLYVQAYFADSTRRDITEMVGHIKAEFAARLHSNAWLDEATRNVALEKLGKMDIQVGYPDDWVDFSGLDIRPGDHFGNVQRANRFAFQREISQIDKPVHSNRFAVATKTTPIAANSAYNVTNNTIDITAAILQPPFFQPGGDAAANYCAIGAVIGHELTHGFDSQGRQYDPQGNLRNWWTPEADRQFQQRTDVLVDQYNRYEILPGLMHNGAQTVTENTADLGGLTLAHAALQRHLASHPEAKAKVDGLTADQRCFVAWTQMWAFKARPERLRFLVSVDVHGISFVRAVAPLVHLDAFHRAFGTRPGDAMWRAPEQRVVIW